MIRRIGSTALAAIASSAVGFLSDWALVHRFGSGAEMDAYRICASILTLATQMLLMQILPLSLVPIFSGTRAAKGDLAAVRQAWRITLVFAVVGLGGALLTFLWPGLIVEVVGPGLHGSALDTALRLVPAISVAFASLSACGVLAALLTSFGTVWTASVATLLMNGALLACLILTPLHTLVENVRDGLLVGAVGAFLFHAALAVRTNTKLSNMLPKSLLPGTSASSRFGQSFLLWSVIMLGTHLVNVLFFRKLSILDTGSASDYAFAFRLTTLLSLPVNAIVIAAFPELSRATLAQSSALFHSRIGSTARSILLYCAPAVAVGMVLKFELLQLILARSSVDLFHTERISTLFGILLAGAPTGGLIALSHRVLASLDLQKQALWGLAAMLTATAATIGFVKDVTGLAIAWDIIFWASTAAVVGALRALQPSIGASVKSGFAAVLVLISTATGGACFAARHYLSRSGASPLVMVLLVSLVGLCVCVVVARLTGVEEADCLSSLPSLARVSFLPATGGSRSR